MKSSSSKENYKEENYLEIGAIAQSGEHLVCNQEVVGSIPTGSKRRLYE